MEVKPFYCKTAFPSSKKGVVPWGFNFCWEGAGCWFSGKLVFGNSGFKMAGEDFQTLRRASPFTPFYSCEVGSKL